MPAKPGQIVKRVQSALLVNNEQPKVPPLPVPRTETQVLARAQAIEGLIEQMTKSPPTLQEIKQRRGKEYFYMPEVADPRMLRNAIRVLGWNPAYLREEDATRDHQVPAQYNRYESRQRSPRPHDILEQQWQRALKELHGKVKTLRFQAQGEKNYPASVCRSCQELTGWTDSEGRCNDCALHGAADRHKLVEQPDGFDEPTRWERALARIGIDEPLARRVQLAWASIVRSGLSQAGPVMPQKGYGLWLPYRIEETSRDGSDTLIRFAVAWCEFDGRRWRCPDIEPEQQRETDSRRRRRTRRRRGERERFEDDLRMRAQRNARPQPLMPTVFSARLPIEQLLDAWIDFELAVTEFNEEAWQEAEAERERERERDEQVALRRRRRQMKLDEGKGVLSVMARGTRRVT